MTRKKESGNDIEKKHIYPPSLLRGGQGELALTDYRMIS